MGVFLGIGWLLVVGEDSVKASLASPWVMSTSGLLLWTCWVLTPARGAMRTTKSSSEATDSDRLLSVEISDDDRDASDTLQTISSSESSEDVWTDGDAIVDDREMDEIMSNEEEVDIAERVGEESAVVVDGAIVEILAGAQQ